MKQEKSVLQHKKAKVKIYTIFMNYNTPNHNDTNKKDTGLGIIREFFGINLPSIHQEV